jgi:hypothetical protein
MAIGDFVSYGFSRSAGARDVDTLLQRRHGMLTLLSAAAALGPWYLATPAMAALTLVVARNAYVFRNAPTEADVHSHLQQLETENLELKAENDDLKRRLEELTATPALIAAAA